MEKLNSQEIKEMILDYVKKEYLYDEDTEIDFDTALISSGFVDSFSMVSLLIFLERKFNIKIPANKSTPEAFDSVNNIYNLVNQYL